MTDRIVLTPRGSVAVGRAGDGPTVVLVHGLPGSRGSWDKVVPYLTPAHDVVVVDLLGFGQSDKPTHLADLHATAQSEALLAVLDALAIPAATLIGHDFGGPVVLSAVARAPERVIAVGLLSANAFGDTPIPFPLSTVTWPVFGGLFARALFSGPSLRMMLRSGVGTPAVSLARRVYIGSRRQRRTIRTVFGGSLRELARLFAPVQEALESVTVPGVVLWGDRDPFFTIEQGRRTAAALRAPFIPLENAGHFLPEERPAEVASAISELVARAGERL